MLQEININTHEDEKVFSWAGDDLVQVGYELSVGLDCLVELSLNESDHSDKGAEADCVNCEEISDIRQVISLIFWVIKLAVVESFVD